MNITNHLPADVSQASDRLCPTPNSVKRGAIQDIDASQSGTDSSTDSVSLSSGATTIPAERQLRLLATKEAVANGSYNIPASDVANAMLKKLYGGSA